MNLIVFPLHEEQVIEVNTSAMDMRGATSGSVTDGKRIGRRTLIQVLEEGSVSVRWLIVVGRDELVINQLGKVALSHVGAANMVVHPILASDDQPGIIWNDDDSS